MNKIILFILCLICAGMLQAQDTIKISAGGLAKALIPFSTIKQLILLGEMDARDFLILRDSMPSLQTLNMESIIINEFKGEGGTDIYNKDAIYAANEIPQYAFASLNGALVNISLPVSLISIGIDAFQGCRRLKSITIPSSVGTIKKTAFTNCSVLESVSILSPLTEIGDFAFAGCISLVGITLPASLTLIGNGSFNGCASLSSITIPPSVTSIGESAFGDDTSLTSVIILAFKTKIRARAFENCSALSFIRVSDTLPVDLSRSPNVFNGVDKTTCILYVPIGRKSAYRTAIQWRDFRIILVFNSTAETGIWAVDKSKG